MAYRDLPYHYALPADVIRNGRGGDFAPGDG